MFLCQTEAGAISESNRGGLHERTTKQFCLIIKRDRTANRSESQGKKFDWNEKALGLKGENFT
jgi:hypothetical protein